MAGQGSNYVNLFVLRRAYNKDNVGRGEKGTTRRQNLHTTVTFLAYSYLGRLAPLGQGGYGSSIVETAVRLMLYMFGFLSDDFAELLGKIVLDRSAVVSRLRHLADIIETLS